MTSEFRAREPRYRPNNDIALSVILQREETAGTHDVQLMDISNNGVWLRTTTCLKFEETIAVRILAIEADFEFEMVGQVRWIKSAGDDQWNVGCHIRPPVADETLNLLANLCCIDRRCKSRSQVQLPATVTVELKEGQTPVTLHNISQSGFGFSTSEPFAVRKKIMVEVDGADGETIDIEAQVEWEVKEGDIYRYGCSFLSPMGYDGLRGLIEVESTTTESGDKTSATKIRQRSVWVTLAAFIVFVVPCLLVVSIDAGRSPAMVTTPNRAKHRAEKVAGSDSNSGVSETITEIDVADASESFDRLKAFDSRKLQPEEDGASPPSFEEEPHPPVEYRAWIDNTGRYRVVARLEGVEKDVARLLKENGRQTFVPLARLSQEDVLYVRRWLQNRQSRQSD